MLWSPLLRCILHPRDDVIEGFDAARRHDPFCRREILPTSRGGYRCLDPLVSGVSAARMVTTRELWRCVRPSRLVRSSVAVVGTIVALVIPSGAPRPIRDAPVPIVMVVVSIPSVMRPLSFSLPRERSGTRSAEVPWVRRVPDSAMVGLTETGIDA